MVIVIYLVYYSWGWLDKKKTILATHARGDLKDTLKYSSTIYYTDLATSTSVPRFGEGRPVCEVD